MVKYQHMVGIVKGFKTQDCDSCMRGFKSHYPPLSLIMRSIGVSPSGKAMDSDSIMRRFESCYPSQNFSGHGQSRVLRSNNTGRHSQVVRQRSAKPLFPGSNPGVASISVKPIKLIVVGIVKWLRQRVVAPLCVGSNPTIHPKK